MNKANYDARISACLLDFVEYMKKHDVYISEVEIKEFCILRGIYFTGEHNIIEHWEEYAGSCK